MKASRKNLDPVYGCFIEISPGLNILSNGINIFLRKFTSYNME
jgi:hypothetical protein